MVSSLSDCYLAKNVFGEICNDLFFDDCCGFFELGNNVALNLGKVDFESKLSLGVFERTPKKPKSPKPLSN